VKTHFPFPARPLALGIALVLAASAAAADTPVARMEPSGRNPGDATQNPDCARRASSGLRQLF